MVMAPGERRRAVLVSMAFAAAVTLPGVRVLVEREAGDGFPLSTYPMFDEDPGHVLELPTVVALTTDGTDRLSPRLIAGTDQVVQAWEAVRAAIARGPEATDELCEEVAGRLDAPVWLAVVIERYDTLEWASDPGAEPQERRTVARCQAHG
jgi:predicted component of type VI protein secretion system